MRLELTTLFTRTQLSRLDVSLLTTHPYIFWRVLKESNLRKFHLDDALAGRYITTLSNTHKRKKGRSQDITYPKTLPLNEKREIPRKELNLFEVSPLNQKRKKLILLKHVFAHKGEKMNYSSY